MRERRTYTAYGTTHPWTHLAIHIDQAREQLSRALEDLDHYRDFLANHGSARDYTILGAHNRRITIPQLSVPELQQLTEQLVERTDQIDGLQQWLEGQVAEANTNE